MCLADGIAGRRGRCRRSSTRCGAWWRGWREGFGWWLRGVSVAPVWRDGVDGFGGSAFPAFVGAGGRVRVPGKCRVCGDVTAPVWGVVSGGTRLIRSGPRLSGGVDRVLATQPSIRRSRARSACREAFLSRGGVKQLRGSWLSLVRFDRGLGGRSSEFLVWWSGGRGVSRLSVVSAPGGDDLVF